jgi:hypothetical protein
MRIPCIKCGTAILQFTASANGGICGPCARGAGFCIICGKRVWEANPAGNFIHFNCESKRNDDAIATVTGIGWRKPEDIDWTVLQTGILNATRNAFKRIAAAHPDRLVREVVVEYQIDEGVMIAPCVTFANGESLNASLNDKAFDKDIEPFDRAITRIGEAVDHDHLETYIDLLQAKTPAMMQSLFGTLEKEDFGLRPTDDCTRILREF